MRKIIGLFLFLSFATLHLWSQSDTVFIRHIKDYDSSQLKYKTDTVIFDSFFKNKILYGTMVLPQSAKQLTLFGHGLTLDSVSIRECKNNDFEPSSKDEILSIKESGDSLIVEILLEGNCCHSFLCDAEIVDNTTINLITIGYGTYCSCMCGYELTYCFSRYDYGGYGKLEDIIIDGNTETRKKLR
ncbi:hypothetical protein [Dysgonomonas sp. 521]|uniref:hypothetical protein n=1 Tax=Dysgonomonas sp. 521 TaxID=2302932 RepID=UPI0013D34ED7|nr:hypothetical protein [Dysgonomonas sp. 521]